MPFFVYGTLKPRELANRRIADLVAHEEPATLPGHTIHIRDGLPGLIPGSREGVQGYLLYPRDGLASRLASDIAAYEPDKLYAPTVVQIPHGNDVLQANTHVFRRETRGNARKWPESEWFLRDDPLLRYGLPTLRSSVIDGVAAGPISPDSDAPAFWSSYLPMLGTYLALFGSVERYTTLAFAASTPSQWIALLDHSPEGESAAASAAPPSSETAYGSDDLDAVKWKPSSRWASWYQVRSNAVHRGKSAFRDADLVASSALGLSEALIILLDNTVDGLAKRWADDARSWPQTDVTSGAFTAMPSDEVGS